MNQQRYTDPQLEAIAQQLQFTAREKSLQNAAKAMGKSDLDAAQAILRMRNK